MAHVEKYPVGRMCQVLEVTTGGYYAWRQRQVRPGGRRQTENERLVAEMRQIDREVNHRYGSPRMHAALVSRGLVCNRKCVERLMRQAGLQATHSKRRRRVVTTQSNHGLPVAGNVLNREFTATMPNQKWVTEIVCTQMTKTYSLAIKTGGDGVADFDQAISHDNSVNQEFDKPGFLFEGEIGQAGPHTLAEIFNMGDKAGKLQVALNLGQELLQLILQGLYAFFDFLAPSLVFLQRNDARQIGIGEPLHLLVQTALATQEIVLASLQLLWEPLTGMGSVHGPGNGLWVA